MVIVCVLSFSSLRPFVVGDEDVTLEEPIREGEVGKTRALLVSLSELWAVERLVSLAEPSLLWESEVDSLSAWLGDLRWRGAGPPPA